MTTLKTRIGAILVTGVIAGAASAALAHDAGTTGYQGWRMGPGYGMHQGYGWGMMGPGYGYHHGDRMHHGYGHHGYGHHGYGMQDQRPGGGMGWRALPQDLSVEQVRHMLEHELQWSGESNLKVGEVKESGDDRIVAEIVKKDGSLVRRYEIDRHTGFRKQLG